MSKNYYYFFEKLKLKNKTYQKRSPKLKLKSSFQTVGYIHNNR
jgi:hypothetical protein